MTLTEKILAQAAGRPAVSAGDNIWVNADILMTHDVCGPGTIGIFEQEFGEDALVFDKEKIVLTPDHYIFTEDLKCIRNIDACRTFARKQGLPYFYDPADHTYSGVCHLTLPQQGHCRPGEVLFGTDSHTCTHGAFGEFATGIGNTDAAFVMGTGKLLLKVPPTLRVDISGELSAGIMAKDVILRIIGDLGTAGATYMALEFAGSTITSMSMEERMTLCNMAIEAGAKNGIIAPDEKTRSYVTARTDKPFQCLYSDEDTAFHRRLTYKAEEFEPVVALPHSPDNVKAAAACSDWKLTRAYIGSCTGGKITDFLEAAKILIDRRVTIPTFLVPATVEVENDMNNVKIGGKTLTQIFADAGCEQPARPSCAACLGGPSDTYGRCNDAEICVSTTNRNFIGRMGSKQASVLLASPRTVAASAITGHITDPRSYA